jgi:hypothetical protein
MTGTCRERPRGTGNDTASAGFFVSAHLVVDPSTPNAWTSDRRDYMAGGFVPVYPHRRLASMNVGWTILDCYFA